jgi:hypothetical protein
MVCGSFSKTFGVLSKKTAMLLSLPDDGMFAGVANAVSEVVRIEAICHQVAPGETPPVVWLAASGTEPYLLKGRINIVPAIRR